MAFIDAVAPAKRSTLGPFPGQPLGSIRPVILVTPDFDDLTINGAGSRHANYVEVLKMAGALPLILPHQCDRIADYLSMGDGVAITGLRPSDGAGAASQSFEEQLVMVAGATDMPLLGISGGMEVLARHLGAEESGRYRSVAHAADGAIDAFEGNTRALCLGVRWHMPDRLTALDQALIGRFVASCRQRAASIRGARVNTYAC